jgi:hypothetical protein
MKSELFRIGSPILANESKLHVTTGFDVLFDGYHEFVHIPDYQPLVRANGTWQGALGHLQKDMKWILSPHCI